MNGCKANFICIWMPITRQDHSPCVAGKAAGVNCMDGISVQFFNVMIKKLSRTTSTVYCEINSRC